MLDNAKRLYPNHCKGKTISGAAYDGAEFALAFTDGTWLSIHPEAEYDGSASLCWGNYQRRVSGCDCRKRCQI